MNEKFQILKTETLLPLPKAETLKSKKLKRVGRRRDRRAETKGGCKGRQVYSRAPLARVMRIHQMVQGGSFPNCSSIARELEVAVKTVTRDIELMRSQLGWPVEYDGKQRGYFYSGPVEGFPSVPMSEAEILSLLIAREAMAQYKGTPFQAQIEGAVRKLGLALKQSAPSTEDVSKVVAFHTVGADKADEPTFRELTEAARQRRVVRFSHRKVGAAERLRREVQPYCILCINNHWYLVGFDVERKAIRKFAIPRIRELAVTDERFIMAHHFDPAEYMRTSFGAFKGEDDYEVVIDFDAWASDLIRGRQWHGSQEITELPGGTIRFRMRLDSIKDAERWVLSWGTHATVVRPAALCNRVHEIAVELAERYLKQLKAEAAQPVPRYEPHFKN
jgi:predicted DNA-binding transcriptional regulator YafY